MTIRLSNLGLIVFLSVSILLFSNTSYALSANAKSEVIVRLKLDDIQLPSIAIDSSSRGNDGAINGASFVPDSADGSPFSLDFDGVDDGVSLGALDVSGTGLTLAAWVKADTFIYRCAYFE